MIKIDSSSFIYSLKMDYIRVLISLYEDVIITKSVFREVIIKGKEKGRSEALLGDNLIKQKQIVIHEKDEYAIEQMELRLGKGETEVINNSIIQRCPCMIDDKKAKIMAEKFNLDVKNIPISLLEAYKKRIIEDDDFNDYLKKWVRYANPSNEEIYYVKKMKELLE